MGDDPTTGHTITPAPRVAEAPACVVIIYGGDLGRCIKLSDEEITISRDDSNGISVPLHTISRQHARPLRSRRDHTSSKTSAVRTGLS